MKYPGYSSKKFLSDEEIIARFRATGNAAVLGTIFNRYDRLVYGLCLKYMKNTTTAEDETMCIFEKLIGEVQKYDIENFRAWFYTYSKNHCLMELRKRKPIIVEFDSNVISLSSENSPGSAFEYEVELEKKKSLLQMLIGFLKKEQRTCLIEFYNNNKSYRDVSSLTGLSLKEVKSHIQNGKRNLKIQFEKLYHKNNNL